MKKIFLILMALVMVFTLVACNSKPCTTHVDENTDNICDVCGAEIPPAGAPDCTAHIDVNRDEKCDNCGAYVAFTDEQASAVLASAIFAQLEAVNSMKVDFSFEMVLNSEYWYEGDLEADKNYMAGIANGSLIATMTEDGFTNAKLEIEVLTKETADAEYEPDEDEAVSIYIVNGFIYEYDTDTEKYDVSPMVEEEDVALVNFINTVLDLEATDDEKAEALSLFGDAFVATFDYANKKASFSYDGKAAYDKEYAYLTGLDLETKTVKGYLDDALADVDPELTVDVLLEKLSENLDLTVLEAYDAIDAWLTEEYETTIQGIMDTFVNDERVEEVLRAYLEYDGLAQEEIDASLAELEEMKTLNFREELETSLTENEIADVSLYELICVIIAFNFEGEGEMPSKEEFFELVDTVLEMTIAEFEEEYGDLVSDSIEEMEACKIDAADVKIDIAFSERYAVTSIDLSVNFDATIMEESEVEGKKNVDDVVMKFTCKLYELSVSATEIEAPGEDDLVLQK